MKWKKVWTDLDHEVKLSDKITDLIANCPNFALSSYKCYSSVEYKVFNQITSTLLNQPQNKIVNKTDLQALVGSTVMRWIQGPLTVTRLQNRLYMTSQLKKKTLLYKAKYSTWRHLRIFYLTTWSQNLNHSSLCNLLLLLQKPFWKSNPIDQALKQPLRFSGKYLLLNNIISSLAS